MNSCSEFETSGHQRNVFTRKSVTCLPSAVITTRPTRRHKGSIVRKGDIIIVKNYLSEDEIDTLNRLVTIFIENAELRAKERKDALLSFQGKDILQGKGSISNEQAEEKARAEYEGFDARRKQYDALLADQDDIKELEELSKSNQQ